jgi:hypothetical protein
MTLAFYPASNGGEEACPCSVLLLLVMFTDDGVLIQRPAWTGCRGHLAGGELRGDIYRDYSASGWELFGLEGTTGSPRPSGFSDSRSVTTERDRRLGSPPGEGTLGIEGRRNMFTMGVTHWGDVMMAR